MIHIKKAHLIIENTIKALGSEIINVTNSIDRTLYEDIKAKNSNPAFNASAMDGIAVKYTKLLKNPNSIYEVIGEVFAGNKKNFNIKINEAVKIYTGGQMPCGSDTVIVQENIAYLEKSFIKIKGEVRKNQFVRKEGRDFKAGDLLLKKNKKISPVDLSLMISAGVKKVKVFKKLSVALLSTGDELIKPEEKIEDGQVYASSLYMLKELIIKAGCNINELKTIKDNKKSIQSSLEKVKNADLIITTGGVSVGKKDLIKSVLAKLDFKLKFWRVSVVPGKPLLFGLLNKVPLFGLPGNPVSSYVCFMLFVLKAINKMNSSEKIKLKSKNVKLKNEFYHSSERTAYLRGRILKSKGEEYVKVLSDQDSSLLKQLSYSNCLVKVKPIAKKFKPDAILKIIFFSYS